MGETTTISWTDHTFNGWWGCTRVSPGCEHCYAETFDKRVGGDHWGPGKPRRTFGESHWKEPLKWDAKAREDGVIRKMFCFSMADIFDTDAPAGERERFWDLCRNTPHLIKQLLTKRSEGYEELLPTDLMCDPLIWKGITAENQPWFDKRWRDIAHLPGIRWISHEPALGQLFDFGNRPFPDWLVFGGETGNAYRPLGEHWAKQTQEICANLGIKFFMKQWSARTPNQGQLLIPDFLRVREFPSEKLVTA